MLSKLPILLVFVFCSSVFSYQEGIANNDAIEIATEITVRSMEDPFYSSPV